MDELFAIDYLTFFGIISTFTNSIRKQVRNLYRYHILYTYRLSNG